MSLSQANIEFAKDKFLARSGKTLFQQVSSKGGKGRTKLSFHHNNMEHSEGGPWQGIADCLSTSLIRS